MINIFREPIVRFLAIGFFIYLGWMAMYEWIIHPWGALDNLVISNTIFFAQKILHGLDYATETDGARVMGIVGTPGLFIGDNCNGISLFALFSIFVIAFPGKIFSKFLFISSGIIIIHFLNILRVVALAIIETYSYEWTEFNHTYTFTIIIYACIFLLWIYWIDKYSGLKKR